MSSKQQKKRKNVQTADETDADHVDAEENTAPEEFAKRTTATNNKVAVVSDKNIDDDQSASSVKENETQMTLGEIYKIEDYIAHAKLNDLQILHTVSLVGVLIDANFILANLAIIDLLWYCWQADNVKKEFA